MTGMQSQGEYAGKAVVITGGTRGIGAGIARAFLAAGADVLVCGRTPPADDAALPAANGRAARFRQTDVRDPDQAAGLIAAAREQFGRLDVLILQRRRRTGSSRCHGLAPLPREDHRAEPDRTAALRAGR